LGRDRDGRETLAHRTEQKSVGADKNDIDTMLADAGPPLRRSGDRSNLLWARSRELGARCPSRRVGQAIYPV
jgi:hypothetical protein